MSSEEMRTELERFVNTGLREGWTGWPRKVGPCVADRFAGQWSPAPVRGWLGGDGWICPTGLPEKLAALHSLC